MAIVYSFSKTKDIYMLGVSQDTSYVLYSLCGNKETKVEESTVLSGNTSLFNIKTDGSYKLVLSVEGETDTTQLFNAYHNLQNSIIIDINTILACTLPSNCENENSCKSKKEKEYLQYKDIFIKLFTFQSLYFDSITESLSTAFTNFLSDAVGSNKCKFQNAINTILKEECIYGSSIGNSSNTLFIEFVSLYYYAIYFIEKNLAGVDDDELDFVESKFDTEVIKGQISESTCIQEEVIEEIFDNVLSTINTKPTVDSTIITVPNNLPNNLFNYTFSSSDFTNNFSDVQGDSPYRIKFSVLPVRGTFLYNGNPVVVGTEYLISNANLLTYSATIDVAQSIFDILVFQVSDDNIIELYSDMANVTMNTAGYINQPISQLGDLTVNKDNRENHTYTISDFTTSLVPPYVDPEGDSLDAIRVDSLPAGGQLELNGNPVSVNDIIPATSINSGLFVWIAPDQDASASNNWAFSARDSGSLQWIS